MTNYLQPLRPNLKSISNMILTYDEIVKVEYAQSDLNPGGREELYYHKGLRLPEGVKAKRNSAKSNVATANSGKTSKAPKLFVSYAHANNKWLKEFKRHLDIYHQQNILNVWTDTSIMAGEGWDKAIKMP